MVQGPLQTNKDIITAAQRISEAGCQLDKVEIDISILKRKNICVQVARGVREACPESETRRDLGAYLQRIALYCHQLDICSKVEGGQLIVALKIFI